MALRQRLSRPFGRSSPPFREEEAMNDLVKLIRENVTHRYETGWAVRTRSCDGKTRVEMLDGAGGDSAGFANACDIDAPVIAPAGFSELWWSQRSNGRTVRLLFDGPRGGKGMQIAQKFPAARPLPDAYVPPATTKIVLAVGDGSTYAVARSTDDGATFAGVTSANLPTRPAGWRYSICYGNPGGANVWVMGGAGSNQIAYSTDDGETWTGCGEVMGASQKVYDLAWNGSYFVAVGTTVFANSKLPIAVSANGIDWALVDETSGGGRVTNASVIKRIGTSGTRFVAPCDGPNTSLAIATSDDNGASWYGYNIRHDSAPATITPPEYTTDWITFMQLSGYVSPMVGDGTIIAGIGYHSTPTHYGVWYGDTFNAALDPTTPLGTPGIFYLASDGGYRVNEAQDVVSSGADSIALIDMIWDGAQFLAILKDWYPLYGTPTAWLSTSADAATWAQSFTSEGAAPAGFETLNRIRHSGGLYLLAGYKTGENIGIAATDDPTGTWTMGTATEELFAEADGVAVEE